MICSISGESSQGGNDAALVEINPLCIVQNPDGKQSLLAVDAKYDSCMTVDLGIFVYEVATGRLLQWEAIWRRPEGR